jgi:hypothetical protein
VTLRQGSIRRALYELHRKIDESGRWAEATELPALVPGDEALHPTHRLAPIEGPNPDFAIFAPADLQVDAKRFQFRFGGDKFGGDWLKRETQWKPGLASGVLVWQDLESRNFIVDGHERLALAKRVAAAHPAQNPKLIARVLRESNGITDKLARTLAALKNMGTSAAVEAAKVLKVRREDPALAVELPSRVDFGGLVQELVELSDGALAMVAQLIARQLATSETTAEIQRKFGQFSQ